MTPYGQWHYREMEVFVKALGFSALDAIRAGVPARQRGRWACMVRPALSRQTIWQTSLLLTERCMKDLTCLALNSNIKQVLLGGKSVDLSPLPARTDPPGMAGFSLRPQNFTTTRCSLNALDEVDEND